MTHLKTGTSTRARNSMVSALSYNESIDKLVESLQELDSPLDINKDLNANREQDLYFKDEIRKIDYIFVFNYRGMRKNKVMTNRYIKALQGKGLQFESQFSKKNHNILFIKVHSPKIILLRYAHAFDIDLACNTDKIEGHIPKDTIRWFWHSKIEEIDIPKSITDAERIMITYELCKDAPFGDGTHEYGLQSLLKYKYILDAYPLHDGTSKLGPDMSTNLMNTRQVLIKYWANLRNCLISQPIDKIYEYYGAEFAFFFAFYEYYTWMLVPLALIGILSLIFGASTYDNHDRNYISKFICNSDGILCPYCRTDVVCGFKHIKDQCSSSKLSYILDNNGSLLYAILLCIWATVFLELWKRKQAILKCKWNLLNIEEDPYIRPEFILRAKYWRESKYGKMVPYLPTKIRMARLSLSFIVIGLLDGIVLLAGLGVVMVKILVSYILVKVNNIPELTDYIVSISAMVGNSLMLIFMILFEMVYMHISKALTNFENPPTQSEYDRSYIYKQYSLNFVNAYTHLYYTSFVKGTFFTHPGDHSQYAGLGIINVDHCLPEGCITNISTQLLFTIVGKALLKRGIELATIFMGTIYRKKKLKLKCCVNSTLPVWEKSYYKRPARHYYLFKDQLELVLQYGFIILFSAAFPLAPLIALFYNFIFIRIDAYKFLKFYRRPVPHRTEGIGPWNSILRTLTYIGIATNAFLIAFTSMFIARVVMTHSDADESEDYFNYTFSVFNISDYNDSLSDMMMINMNGSVCYYVGQRYPPDHEFKYENTGSHWKFVSFKLLSVLAFEIIVVGITGTLAFAIPDLPRSVQQRILYDKRTNQEKRENDMIEDLIKNMQNGSTILYNK